MVTKYQKFGDGYKAEAVKLYRESNQSIAETARNLGLKESTLANWVKKDKENEAVAAGEAPLTPAERTRIRELEAALVSAKACSNRTWKVSSRP
jgi:transposase